ncbi:MAG: PKD domain-containing protein, partial [Bacteroidia bacterium]
NTLWKFVPDSACSALNSTNPPQAIITANDPLPCSPLQVNFQSGGSAAAFDYQWDFGDPATTQDTATIVNPQYTYSAPGIYTISLIVSASNGCRSGSDTATFELDLSDALPLSSSITASACSSYEAPDGTVLTQSGVYPFTFTAANGCDSIVTLNLTINAAAVGELDIFSCGPYTADDGTVYSESSVFTTSLQAANGCDSLVTNTLTVYTLPDVDAGPAIVSIVAGDTVQLNASGAISYVWSPTEGLSCSICSAPLASPQQSTSYIVTGTDSLGCTKTDTVRVEVDFTCKEVFIPTIFSPNSKGPQANETFCVFSDCVEQFKLVIHNRWGERIFETEDINQCWDGTFKGQAAQSGVYAFNVYVRQLDGVVVNKTGTITLVQ